MTINRSRDLGFGADPTADELTTWATIGSTTGSPTTGQFTYLGVVHNYWKWTASGSVTFSAAGRVKTLVVAGGGGSGSDSGGGAGGLIQTVLDAKATVYNVNVGGGGAGAGDTSARGASGTDSYFGGLVALGGGGGGSSIIIGAAGGSAGGSSRIGGTTSATTTYGPQGYGCTVSTGDGGGGAGGAGGTSGGVDRKSVV